MTVYVLVEGDVTVENGMATRWDGLTTPATAELVASLEAGQVEAQARAATTSANADARTALSAVLALAESFPYPTPEENAIVDAQAASALDGFRTLADPPADVVALAAAVVSWRTAI